eukprot:scaffold2910_cov390-Prasinococcus_capsulatus_cf.AAC.20
MLRYQGARAGSPSDPGKLSTAPPAQQPIGKCVAGKHTHTLMGLHFLDSIQNDSIRRTVTWAPEGALTRRGGDRIRTGLRPDEHDPEKVRRRGPTEKA